jgi:carbon monoxide dehydrogenase subunit G
MELTNSFRVGVAVSEAWDTLTDVERIAPCLPGAQLQEIAGEEFRGIVKVKVGPITAQYKGAATFVERDKDAGRVVLKAEGRDVRGQGNASALITATLTADGDGTDVTVVTDLTITGRVAQFGRGVLADVSSKLLGQFVECLEHDLLGGSGSAGNGNAAAPAAPETERSTDRDTDADGNGKSEQSNRSPNGPTTRVEERPTETSSRRIESREPEPVDLLDAAGIPVAKRAIPLVAAALVLILLFRKWRKGGGRR